MQCLSHSLGGACSHWHCSMTSFDPVVIYDISGTYGNLFQSFWIFLKSNKFSF